MKQMLLDNLHCQNVPTKVFEVCCTEFTERGYAHLDSSYVKTVEQRNALFANNWYIVVVDEYCRSIDDLYQLRDRLNEHDTDRYEHIVYTEIERLLSL